MATPKKPRPTALKAEPSIPEPVSSEFVPEAMVLPQMDIKGFLMTNLEAVGFTSVTVEAETAPDGHVRLKVAGKNANGALMSCSPVFPPEKLHIVVMQILKAVVNAAGWADPHMDIQVVG